VIPALAKIPRAAAIVVYSFPTYYKY